MLEFFDLRNVVTQMATIGRLTGLLEPWEKSSVENLKTGNNDDEGGLASMFRQISSSTASMTTDGLRHNALGSVKAGSKHLSTTAVKKKMEETEKSMKFSVGWIDTLTNELFQHYLLLVNFSDYDKGQEATEALIGLETEVEFKNLVAFVLFFLKSAFISVLDSHS